MTLKDNSNIDISEKELRKVMFSSELYATTVNRPSDINVLAVEFRFFYSILLYNVHLDTSRIVRHESVHGVTQVSHFLIQNLAFGPTSFKCFNYKAFMVLPLFDNDHFGDFGL